jgi:thiol:disulfide interchange protein DsbC
MRKFLLALSLAGLMTGNTAAFAQLKSNADEQRIRDRFASFPQLQIESIAPAEIGGLYKVQLLDGPMVYASADGRHFVLGEVFELRDNDLVNLAEEARDVDRATTLATLDPAQAIVFPAAGERKATLTVFTDVDCFYCQKLHEEIASYSARGIEVRYLAFPRKGIASDTYEKMVSAWCASDQQSALTKLKQKKAIPKQECVNPVAEQFALGQSLGIRGTPALLLESGRMLPGYVGADDLVPLLGIEEN